MRSLPGRRDLALIAVALTIVFAQFPIVLVPVTVDPIWFYRVQVFLADLPLGLVMLLALPELAGRIRRRSVDAVLGLGLATIALLWIALVVHPSLIGLQTVLRVSAALVLAYAIATMDRAGRSILVGAVTVTALAQASLALAQLVRGGPLGLPALGEFADPLLRVGSSLAPRGTMEHPYVLAGLALVAAGLLLDGAASSARPLAWSVAAALASLPVGLTYMRTAALATALAVGSLAKPALAGSARHRWAMAALLVGTGLPAILTSDGWLTRAQGTIRNEVPTDTGREVRGDLFVQTARLMSNHLLFGIGPGLTAERTRELRRIEPGTQVLTPPVHMVPLLVASEAGVPAGVTATLLVIALGIAAIRSGRGFLYLMFVPFVILDQYPYTRLQGLVLLAVWGGAIAGWEVAKQHEDALQARERLARPMQ